MTRKIIHSNSAPEPIGPYSQAVQFEKLIFTSGQIAINPENNELIAGDVEDQTRQVLENLRAVLEAANASLDTVIKTTIFLKNMADFVKVNNVYDSFFGSSVPARSTVEVARLPKDVLVEIDCIAAMTG
ncbi:MAG: RidA family protein [Calditrichia bacterium]|jgi:2-iminobutanoate/2-iminopropanoate deaminase|nr:RidA family protein [Calditrichia bacterium]